MNRKLFPALVLFFASCTQAQTNKGTGQGLDHLDEQQVMAQLASNNMETLLNRDFDNFKIPEAERDNTRVFIQIRELKSPTGTIAGRRALAVKVAKGLESLLPKATDPDALMEQANDLSRYSILAQVTQLEYFGENPAAQADLKPVAQAAKDLYSRAADVATAKVNALVKGIVNNAQFAAAQPQMDRLNNLQMIAAYCDKVGSYSLCIALPKGDPQRKTLADDAIKFLKDYDDPASTLQSQVRLLTGKLQLISATKADEYHAVITTFDTLVNNKNADGSPLVPAPVTEQQDKARYFRIVAMIGQRKLKDAETAISDLETWEVRNFIPSLDETSQLQVKAALSMLKFRLYSGQSDLTANEDEKKADNDKAIETLAKLLREQPSLKELVFDQMLGRLPSTPDYTTLNPLILLALENQSFPMVREKDPVALDEKMMTRSISAAREIINRKGTPGVDDHDVLTSAIFIPIGLQTMKEDKEACSAYMDFAEQHKDDPRAKDLCIERAKGIIGALEKKDPSDPDTIKLHDRFLPLAINAPFNEHKYLAFTYAAQLQLAKKYKDAAAYYKLVPAEDPSYPKAQYLQMLALSQQMNDPTIVGPERTAMVNQILDLRTAIDGFLTSATKPEDRKTYSNWVVTADCYAADLTRAELKDPAKSLEILNGFEDRVKDSSKPDEAHISALQLRISDYMAQGKVHDATTELVKLSAVNPEKASDLMFSVLKSVEADMDKATALADKRPLAQDRAELTGFIVDYTAKSKNPKELERLPSYQLYDADSKREAAELLDDPKQKEAKLHTVLQEYKDLMKIKDKEDAANEGAGLTNFDLGNYAEAVKALGPLVAGNKIGTPMIKAGPEGAQVDEENPQYWEITYKDCKSVVEMYKQKPGDAGNKDTLEKTRQFVNVLIHQNGEKTGGKTYHDDFLKLRDEIVALQGKK